MILASVFLWKAPFSSGNPSTKNRGALKRLLKNRNVLIFIFSVLLIEIANQMGYLYMSIYGRELGANNSQLGFLWACATGAELVMMFFIPKIIERFAIHRILLFGMIFVALRWTLFAFVDSWWQLVPIQLLQFVTIPFVYVGAVTFMDMESHSDIRFTAQAFYSTFVIHSGMIIGSLLGGEVGHSLGYSTIYLIGGIAALVASLIVAFFVKEPKQHELTRELF
jgi:PPP family 3-phenylpropionic acid transporter